MIMLALLYTTDVSTVCSVMQALIKHCLYLLNKECSRGPLNKFPAGLASFENQDN